MCDAFESSTSLFSCSYWKKPFSQPPPLSYLHDDLLMDIFSRLPYKTVFLCKCVCKSWHSLLSDRAFLVRFLNHMRKTRRTTDDREWAFILTKDHTNKRPMRPTINVISGNGSLFTSHKLTFKFLPFYKEMKVVATFKDLVLCFTWDEDSDSSTSSSFSSSMRRVYHICNPVTKKWVTLPSCPLVPDPYQWAALICEDFYQYDDDNGITIREGLEYRFRVVVAQPLSSQQAFSDGHCPFKLTIFCSESGQWKRFRLFVPSVAPTHVGTFNQTEGLFYLEGVVCNRMVYLWHGYRFGAFDPFDEATTTPPSSSQVAPTSSKGNRLNAPTKEEEEGGGGENGELTIKMVLPLPSNVDGKLVESGGRLLSIGVVSHTKEVMLILELVKTDHEPPTPTPTTTTLVWEVRACLTLDLSLLSSKMRSNVNLINDNNHVFLQPLGIHPTNKDFFYLLASTRSLGKEEEMTELVKVCLKPPSYSIRKKGNGGRVLLLPYSPIELQCWPTPIPTIHYL